MNQPVGRSVLLDMAEIGVVTGTHPILFAPLTAYRQGRTVGHSCLNGTRQGSKAHHEHQP